MWAPACHIYRSGNKDPNPTGGRIEITAIPRRKPFRFISTNSRPCSRDLSVRLSFYAGLRKPTSSLFILQPSPLPHLKRAQVQKYSAKFPNITLKPLFAVIDANNDINNTSATQTHWQWILSEVSDWPIMIGRSAHYGSARPTMNDRSRHYPSDNDHRAVTGRLPISHALQSFQPTHTQGTCTHFETDTNTIGELRYWQHCQLPARGRRGVREGSRLGDYPSPTWQSLPIMRTLQRFSTTSRSVGVKVR